MSVYPGAPDNLPLTTNSVTPANKTLFDSMITAINNTQSYLGLTTDIPALGGTETAQIKNLQMRLAALELLVASPPIDYATPLWVSGD